VIEVVCMVYRSPAFLSFMRDQGQVNRFVGNDAEHAVRIWSDVVPYHDPIPDDHYLSRVYRCWNYCVRSSPAEYVCLVNSDMAFSPGWLEALERRLDGKTIPCSRLVEPSYLTPEGQQLDPGLHAEQIDLGRDPATFNFDAWDKMAADLSEDRTEPGGLFMPCVLHRQTFLEVGGYPEGNIVRPVNGDWSRQEVLSGDAYLFQKMAVKGFQHVTCFDSLVYHMQQGEMRHPE